MDRMGAKPINRGELAEAVRDPRTWCGLGVVVLRDGESSHYEITSDDVLVEVDLMPQRQPLLCRLAAAAGGPGHGLWRIPPVGSEVAVVIPGGELEADAMIVGVLASGTAPSGLDADTMVLINPKNVVIKSDQGDVKIDAQGKVSIQTAGGGAQPIARKTDPVDGGKLYFVPGTGGAALVFTPPGYVGATPPGTAIPLTGQISDGSSKAEAG